MNESNLYLIQSNSKKENLQNKPLKFKILKKRKNTKLVKKTITKEDKLKKVREPGIELVRVLAMFGIVVQHLIFFGNMERKYRQYPQIGLISIIFFWHVNSFALISGIVGYKTNKYSSLMHLWFVVFFYSFGIFLLVRKYRPHWINKTDILYQYCLPVIFNKFWYFTAYFGMYLFLPIINKGISNITKFEFKLLVISLISIYVIWLDIINPNMDTFHMIKGYSVLWLLIFYLTGAYIGKYRINYTGIKKVFLCLVCIFLFISSTLICYKIKYYQIITNNYYKKKILSSLKTLFSKNLSSFPMIIQSISITIFLMQLKYNKYVAKIFSFLGPLTFGVYLSHTHPLIMVNIIGNMNSKERKDEPLYNVIKWLIINGLKVSVICLIIDYIRSLLFNILRIRKICIFFENLIFKLFT